MYVVTIPMRCVYITFCYISKQHASHFAGCALRDPQLAQITPASAAMTAYAQANTTCDRASHAHCPPRAQRSISFRCSKSQWTIAALRSRTRARVLHVRACCARTTIADRDRSCDHGSPIRHTPMASCAPRRTCSLVLQL